MVKEPKTLEVLKAEQEREFQELIQKIAGKKYGKVSQSKIKSLASKHVKQFIRTSRRVALEEARNEYKNRKRKEILPAGGNHSP